MKKISSELKKSYILIVGLLLVFIVFSLSQSWKAVYNLNKKSIEHAMLYLVEEIDHAKESDFIEIFSGGESFKRDNKVLSKLELSIRYRDYYYTDSPSLLFNPDKIDEVVFDLGDSAMILSHRMRYRDGFIEITLLQDLKKDLELIKIIITAFLSVIAIALILVIIISQSIIKKVNRSLDSIKMLNESISLDNLKLIRPKDDFIEFENIYNSYEEMLKKLNIQNQRQVEFIHSSSHELKTPLFIMSGTLDVLEKYGHEDREIYSNNIETLKNEVKGMNLLVEKLLFLARSGEYLPDTECFEVSDIILENLYKLKRRYKDIQVNFEPHFLELESDLSLFDILIKNILENAMKYSDNKPIDIVLKETPSFLEISIKDHGVGMNEEQVAQIFNRFYRVDSSRNKQIEGHGLGMSIVKRIIEVIGGEILILSEPEVGTEVLFKIEKHKNLTKI